MGKEDWTMVDHTGRTVSKQDFVGKYTLMYFGFTFCPDGMTVLCAVCVCGMTVLCAMCLVCPIEMKKMAGIADILEERGMIDQVVPVFVSVDYRRDSPAVVKKYINEYSDKLLGLCGMIVYMLYYCVLVCGMGIMRNMTVLCVCVRAFSYAI